MKRIKWPSSIRVELDRDIGMKLDKLALQSHSNRPSVIRRAVSLLWDKLQAEAANNNE
jgi:predicted transcriptional regulator